MKTETKDKFQNLLTKHSKFIDGNLHYVFTQKGLSDFITLIKEYINEDD